MNQMTRTLVFLIVTGLSLAAALGVSYYQQAPPPPGFALVGQEFYPGFNPDEATSLKVVSYDEETATQKTFEVVREDKTSWVIKSHFSYPVDGKEQLAKTAASIIDLKRAALKSRRTADHEQYGVIDPLDETIASPKGRGDRLILKDENDKTLADYIIGHAVEQTASEAAANPKFYVRIPKEAETYIAEMDLKLSTKFADWIDPDVLNLNSEDLRKIRIAKYTLEELSEAEQQQRRDPIDKVKDLEIVELVRDEEKWTVVDLDQAKEEMQETTVNELVKELGELQIYAVRPKPDDLPLDLNQRMESRIYQAWFDREMRRKGFHIARLGRNTPPQVVPDVGKLFAVTKDGILYELNFGEVFTGSGIEVETGFQREEKEKTKKSSGESETEYRYLLVQAHFDPSELGEPPVKPTAPEKPKENTETPNEKEKPASEKTPDETDGAPPPDAGATDPEEGQEKATEPEESAEMKAWREAMKTYETQLKTYDRESKLYQDALLNGQARVDALNQRFSEWFYVISARDFQTLRLARSTLVTAKKKNLPEYQPATPEQPAPKSEPRKPVQAVRPDSQK